MCYCQNILVRELLSGASKCHLSAPPPNTPWWIHTQPAVLVRRGGQLRCIFKVNLSSETTAVDDKRWYSLHSAHATVLSTALDHGTCSRGGWNVMPHVRVLLMVPCAQKPSPEQHRAGTPLTARAVAARPPEENTHAHVDIQRQRRQCSSSCFQHCSFSDVSIFHLVIFPCNMKQRVQGETSKQQQ